MKLICQKTWLTEEEIEAPDGLSPEELREWINDRAPEWAHVSEDNHTDVLLQWQGTTVMDTRDNKIWRRSMELFIAFDFGLIIGLMAGILIAIHR